MVLLKKRTFETKLNGRKAFFINSNYFFMKKVLFFVAVMLLSISTASFAQFKIGGGVTAGSKISMDNAGEKMGFGVNVRGEFSLMDKLALTPGFTYFLPSTPDGYDLTLWQLNADVHYTLAGAGTPVSVYALGGLNYTSFKSEFDVSSSGDGYSVSIEGDVTENEIGINLGAGVSFSKLYGEVKYDTAFEQVAFSVGFMF